MADDDSIFKATLTGWQSVSALALLIAALMACKFMEHREHIECLRSGGHVNEGFIKDTCER